MAVPAWSMTTGYWFFLTFNHCLLSKPGTQWSRWPRALWNLEKNIELRAYFGVSCFQLTGLWCLWESCSLHDQDVATHWHREGHHEEYIQNQSWKNNCSCSYSGSIKYTCFLSAKNIDCQIYIFQRCLCLLLFSFSPQLSWEMMSLAGEVCLSTS